MMKNVILKFYSKVIYREPRLDAGPKSVSKCEKKYIKGVQKFTTGEAPVPRESKRRGVHRDWGELTFHAFAVMT